MFPHHHYKGKIYILKYIFLTVFSRMLKSFLSSVTTVFSTIFL